MTIPLGARADEAAIVAARYGHALTDWEEDRDDNGMKWLAICKKCGAMALAEYTGRVRGETVAAGNTQRMSCASVLKKKARATARREGKA